MLDLEAITNEQSMWIKAILETDESSSAFIVDESKHYLLAPGSILHPHFIYRVLEEGFYLLLKSKAPVGGILAKMPQNWRENEGNSFPIITKSDSKEYKPGQQLDPRQFKTIVGDGYSLLIDPFGGTLSTKGEGLITIFPK